MLNPFYVLHLITREWKKVTEKGLKLYQNKIKRKLFEIKIYFLAAFRPALVIAFLVKHCSSLLDSPVPLSAPFTFVFLPHFMLIFF
jgi:hypothetical protein